MLTYSGLLLFNFLQRHSKLHGVAFRYESGGRFEQTIQGDQETLQKGEDQENSQTVIQLPCFTFMHFIQINLQYIQSSTCGQCEPITLAYS